MDHHHHEDKNTLTDPVCGMAVKETSQFYEKVDSKTFYFCSENCWLKFKNDPAFYINKLAKATNPKDWDKFNCGLSADKCEYFYYLHLSDASRNSTKSPWELS